MFDWTLISDASGARIVSFDQTGRQARLIKEFDNIQGRARSQQLDADKPGRVSKAGAPGTRSAMQPHTSSHDASADAFARKLACILHEELERGAYSGLFLVAPPSFLGTLRSLLDGKVRQVIKGELPKDLVHVSLHELGSHLCTASLFR